MYATWLGCAWVPLSHILPCVATGNVQCVIMRPSSLGGGRILRRTLSVRPSVCPSVRPSRYERHVAPPSELQWHTCTFRQGRISYGHLGRTNSCCMCLLLNTQDSSTLPCYYVHVFSFTHDFAKCLKTPFQKQQQVHKNKHTRHLVITFRSKRQLTSLVLYCIGSLSAYWITCTTRICAAEMAVWYAALCACRKVHTWRWPISENRSFSILDVRS